MKLFVWSNPYQVSYGSSMLIVVAASLDEAKQLAFSELAKSYSYNEYEQDERFDPSTTPLGEPTRVVNIPCAEWHKWEE